MENINLQLIVLIAQLVNGHKIADNCLILQTIYNNCIQNFHGKQAFRFGRGCKQSSFRVLIVAVMH